MNYYYQLIYIGSLIDLSEFLYYFTNPVKPFQVESSNELLLFSYLMGHCCLLKGLSKLNNHYQAIMN